MPLPLTPAQVNASLATAAELQQAGNACFAAKDYRKAHGRYTRMLPYVTGIDPDIGAAMAAMSGSAAPLPQPPRSSLPPPIAAEVLRLRIAAHANSAACLCQLQEWPAAAAAASKAIALQPGNAKALYRRAKALFMMDDLAGAEEDINTLERIYTENGAPAAGTAPAAESAAVTKSSSDSAETTSADTAAAVVTAGAGATATAATAVGAVPSGVAALAAAVRKRIASQEAKFSKGMVARMAAAAAATETDSADSAGSAAKASHVMADKQVLAFPKTEIKVLLLEKISDAAAKIFRDEGYLVDQRNTAMSEDELLEAVTDCHILGVRSKTQVTAKVLQAAKRLLAVGCFCIGTDQTDLPAAAECGKPVFNAPFANTRSVAEMVIAEIIMLLRQIGDRNRECHLGKWNKVSTNCWEARGKTLGIVGYGHVGSQVSVLAESMGMVVKFYDHLPKLSLGNAQYVSSLDALLEQSDIITMHVPLTAETSNMISTEQFAKMKKGAYFINAARGEVVDLDALAEAVKSKQLAGCAVDVYPAEPASAKEELYCPLRGLDNCILTPHIGGSTEEAQANIGIEVSGKIINFINTGATVGCVNLPEVHLPSTKGAHRILNFHQNVPGVLRDINNILSGYNVGGQVLVTQGKVGYLIVELDSAMSDEVKTQIAQLKASIKTRLLY